MIKINSNKHCDKKKLSPKILLKKVQDFLYLYIEEEIFYSMFTFYVSLKIIGANIFSVIYDSYLNWIL